MRSHLEDRPRRQARTAQPKRPQRSARNATPQNASVLEGACNHLGDHPHAGGRDPYDENGVASHVGGRRSPLRPVGIRTPSNADRRSKGCPEALPNNCCRAVGLEKMSQPWDVAVRRFRLHVSCKPGEEWTSELVSQPRDVAVRRFRLHGKRFGWVVVSLLAPRRAILPSSLQSAFRD